jgi:hypothetical protein
MKSRREARVSGPRRSLWMRDCRVASLLAMTVCVFHRPAKGAASPRGEDVAATPPRVGRFQDARVSGPRRSLWMRDCRVASLLAMTVCVSHYPAEGAATPPRVGRLQEAAGNGARPSTGSRHGRQAGRAGQGAAARDERVEPLAEPRGFFDSHDSLRFSAPWYIILGRL